MADREAREETPAKAAIERELVSEVVREPEAALSFGRVFNKDTDFSRIFSRGGTHLEELKVRDLTTLEEDAFSKFTERVRFLQEMESPDKPG